MHCKATSMIVGVLAGFSLSSSSFPMEQGLVGHWEFEEAKGATASDSGPHACNGVITEAKFVAGKTGNAISFAEGNGFVEISSFERVDISSALTVELWIYLNAIPRDSGLASLIKRGAQSQNKLFWLYIRGAGGKRPVPRWVFEVGDGEKRDSVSHAYMAQRRWLHVVCVFSPGRLALYVDGKKSSRATSIDRLSFPARKHGKTLVLGGYLGSGRHTPNALMDEVKIYNRALSDEEIKAKVARVPSAGAKSSPRHVSALAGQRGAWHDRDTWDPKGVPGLDSLVRIRRGDTVVLQQDAEVYRVEVEAGGTFLIDAAAAARSITLFFKDASEAGFGTRDHGQVICRGSPEHHITLVARPKTFAAEIARNVWRFPWKGKIRAEYTTFTGCSSIQAWGREGLDIRHCRFSNGGPFRGGGKEYTVCFNSNTIEHGLDGLVLGGSDYKPFERIAVRNTTRSDIWFPRPGHAEFKDSSFDLDRVRLGQGGNLVSRNHDRVPGYCAILATKLDLCCLQAPFGSEDTVHLLAGELVVDKDCECHNLIIELPATLTVKDGSTLRVRNALEEVGRIVGRKNILRTANSKNVFVVPPEMKRMARVLSITEADVALPDARKKIAVLDTQRLLLGKWLPSFPISYEVLGDLAELSFGRHSLLILGLNEVKNRSAQFEQHRGKLRAFVKDGGFILAFQQNDTNWFDGWLPYSLDIHNGGAKKAKIRAVAHPIFKGVSNADLSAWPGTVSWDRVRPTGPEWNVLAVDADDPEYAIALECKYGNGAVLINNFAFRFKLDDTSDMQKEGNIREAKLFANLLEYSMRRQELPVPFAAEVVRRDLFEVARQARTAKYIADRLAGLLYDLDPKLQVLGFDLADVRQAGRATREAAGLGRELESLQDKLAHVEQEVKAWQQAGLSLAEARKGRDALEAARREVEAGILRLQARVAPLVTQLPAPKRMAKADFVRNSFHIVHTEHYVKPVPGTVREKYKFLKRLHTTFTWNAPLLFELRRSRDKTKALAYFDELYQASSETGVGVNVLLKFPRSYQRPELRCVDRERGIRGYLCWNEPKVLEMLKAQIDRLVALNKQKPVCYLGVNFDEIAFLGGYCDRCKTKFRGYLKSKYSKQELKALGIANPDAVLPPRPSERNKNRVLYMEHREFVAHSLERAVRGVFDYARSLDRNIITYINESLAHHGSGPFKASFARLGQIPDIFGIDPYRRGSLIQAFYLDLIRSTSRGPTIQFTGASWDQTPEQLERDLAIAVPHAQGVGVFCWPRIWKYRHRDPELDHPKQQPKPGFWEVSVATFDKIKSLEKYLIDTTSTAKVALLFSERSLALDPVCDPLGSSVPNGRYMMLQYGIYTALTQEHVQVDPIFAEGLTKEKLAHHRVLFLADASALTRGQIDVVREWTTAGGTLIVTARSTLLDRWGRQQEDYALKDVFGASYVDRVQSPGRIAMKTVRGSLLLGKLTAEEQVSYDASYGYDVVRPATAEVLAVWPDGHPAMLRNLHQQGDCIFITAASPGLLRSGDQHVLDRDAFPAYRRLLSTLIRESLKARGGSLPFVVENAPVDVEVVMRGQIDRSRYVLHFLNYGYTVPVTGTRAKVSLPASASREAVRVSCPTERGAISAQCAGREVSFAVPDFDVHSVVVVEW